MQSATDAAVLAAASSATRNETDARGAGPRVFASSFEADGTAAPKLNLSCDPATGKWSGSASGPYHTSFMAIAGISSLSVSVVSEAVAPTKTYLDIYVSADVSAPMGLGASPSDRTGMLNSFGCAFTCHNGDPAVKVLTSSNDTVITARNRGYKLRIDSIKLALKQIVDKGRQLQSQGISLRFAVYKFGNTFEKVIGVSSRFGASADTFPRTIYGR